MKILKNFCFAGLLLIVLSPFNAFADEGVVLKGFDIKDTAGTIVKNIKQEDVLNIKNEDNSNYFIDIDEHFYPVNKENILKINRDVVKSFSVNSENAIIRTSPGIFGTSIRNLKKNEILNSLSEVKGEFVKVLTKEGISGYVYKPHLIDNVTKAIVSTTGYIIKDYDEKQFSDAVSIVDFEKGNYKLSDNTFIPQDVISFKKPVIIEKLIEYTRKELGKPYVWGATGSSSYDCSGLTQSMMAKLGIYIPRVASDQAQVGKYVSYGDLKKGDLVFFGKNKISHVGIYIGNGNMIHAPQTGDVVKVSSIESDYRRNTFSHGRRMF